MDKKGWLLIGRYGNCGSLSSNEVFLWWCGGNTYAVEYDHLEDGACEIVCSMEFVKGYSLAVENYLATCNYATVNGHFDEKGERMHLPQCFGAPFLLDWAIVDVVPRRGNGDPPEGRGG